MRPGAAPPPPANPRDSQRRRRERPRALRNPPPLCTFLDTDSLRPEDSALVPEIWTETHGTGSPVQVFLHGLNGNACLWDGVETALAGTGTRVYLDLPGHGRSGPLDRYTLGGVAAAVTGALTFLPEPAVFVGHSMGGAVALALAGGWFGVPVRGVLGIGIKTDWSEEERARAAAFATKPRRPFETRDAAEAFLLKAAGLSAGARLVNFRRVGVVEEDGAYYLAAAPAAASLAATWHDSVFAAIGAPFRLARGSADAMVPADAVARHDPDAIEFAGAGHNAHVDAPESVAKAIEVFTASLDRRDTSRPPIRS